MYLWKGLLSAPFTQEAFLSPFYLWSWNTKNQVQSLNKTSSPTEIDQNIFPAVPWQAHGTAGSWARGLWRNPTNLSILWEVKIPSSATTFLLADFYFPLFRGHLAVFIRFSFSLSLFFIPIQVHTFQKEKTHFNSATTAFSLPMESRTQKLCGCLQ